MRFRAAAMRPGATPKPLESTAPLACGSAARGSILFSQLSLKSAQSRVDRPSPRVPEGDDAEPSGPCSVFPGSFALVPLLARGMTIDRRWPASSPRNTRDERMKGLTC
jgi:hypothetical protein